MAQRFGIVFAIAIASAVFSANGHLGSPASVMDLYDRFAGASTETAEVRVLVRRLLGAVVVLLPQLIAVGVKVLHVG